MVLRLSLLKRHALGRSILRERAVPALVELVVLVVDDVAVKIVEAHLMLEEGALDPPDFYEQVMRLQLIGFIRPEMKFPSFPALIAQISTDAADAKAALDLPFFQQYQKDTFITDLTGCFNKDIYNLASYNEKVLLCIERI